MNNQSNESDDIVAVGSISHVLKTVFNQYYDIHDPLEKPPPVEQIAIENDQVDEEESEAPVQEEIVIGRDELVVPEGFVMNDEKYASHAYVRQGLIDMQAVKDELAQHKLQAKGIISYLDRNYEIAKQKDQDEAHRIEKEGLVLKSEIPIGASKLSIHQGDTDKYGSYGKNLVFARDLIEEYELERQDRCGNGPTAKKESVQYVAEAPGYLKETVSLKTRTTIAKKMSTAKPRSEFQQSTKSIKKNKTVHAHEREEHEAILSKMDSKLKFLRNPRFDTTGTGSGHKSLCTTLRDEVPNGKAYFALSPKVLMFEDYVPGKNYQKSLLVKNICAVSRRLRILPPSTPNFTLVKITYPSDGGMLAPGMHCKIVIQFLPDTPANFDDDLTAETEMGNFSIPLRGRREPPILSIPNVLQVGPCLIGNKKSISIECKNSGGKAKFWLLQDEASLENGEIQEMLSLNSFTMTPTEFELDTGDSVNMSVQYEPTKDGEQIESFVLVCDNCEIKTYHLSGIGCIADVAVTQLNEIQLDNQHTELQAIQFAQTNPGSTSTQSIQIQNNCPIELEFQWTQSKSIETKSSFMLEPTTGKILPNDTITVQLHFSPINLNNVQSVFDFRLVGLSSNAIRQGNTESTRNEKDSDAEAIASVGARAFHLALYGSGLPIDLKFSPPYMVLPHEIIAGETITQTVSLVNSSSSSCTVKWGKPSFINLLHESLDSLSPWPTDVNLVEQLNGVPTAATQIGNVIISPIAATVPAGDNLEFTVQLNPFKTGYYRCLISCDANYIQQKLTLGIDMNIKSPIIQFSEARLNFGLVSVGGVSERTIVLKNSTNAVQSWLLRHIDAVGFATKEMKRISSNDSILSRYSQASSSTSKKSFGGRDVPPRAYLMFEPQVGTLEPFQTIAVKVVCLAGKVPQRFRGVVECHKACGGYIMPSSFVSMQAEIQSPKVYLSQTCFMFGTTYLGVEVTRSFELINLSNLEAKFKWIQLGGEHPSFHVSFEPASGIITSKEKVKIRMTYVPIAPGKIQSLLACNVRGLLVPLGFEIMATQKSLVLSYSIIADNAIVPKSLKEANNGNCEGIEPPAVQPIPNICFGDNVPLYKRTTVQLLIRNFSGLSATISADVKNYPASNVDLPKVAENDTAVFLGDTHEANELFTSSKGLEYVKQRSHLLEDRKVLQAGGGIAILVEPRRIVIPAWEQAILSFTCFNDMPGKYVDNVTISIEGMPPAIIKSSITVSGCPLSIDQNCVGLETNKGMQAPSLSFGEVPAGAQPIPKTIRVANSGPIDANISWRVIAAPEEGRELLSVSLTCTDDGKVNLKIKAREYEELVPRFKIIPESKIAKKYSKTAFQILFDPPAIESSSFGTIIANADWMHPTDKVKAKKDVVKPLSGNTHLKSAVGMAFRAVRSIAMFADDQVGTSKKQGTSIDCITMNLSSRTIQPRLEIDKNLTKTTQGKIKFTCTPDSERKDSLRTICLVNKMQATMIFKLDISGAFQLSKFDAVVPQKTTTIGLHLTDAESFRLPPGESMQLDVLFIPNNTPSNTMSTLPKSTSDLSLEDIFDGQLTILFSTNAQQTINLRGHFLRPTIVVSPSEYSFGVVHLSTPRSVELYFSNPTAVHAKWSISHIPASIPKSRAQKAAAAAAVAAGEVSCVDLPSVFKLSSKQGTLDGQILPLFDAGYRVPEDPNRTADAIFQANEGKKAPFFITTTFLPKSAQRYKSRFRVHVEQGNYFDFVLEGTGTLDESNQQSQDRKLVHTNRLQHTDYVFQ